MSQWPLDGGSLDLRSDADEVLWSDRREGRNKVVMRKDKEAER